jgi:hypothetical protein
MQVVPSWWELLLSRSEAMAHLVVEKEITQNRNCQLTMMHD